jgi:hypothetical protein
MSELWAEDSDDRPERMTRDPACYFGSAWAESKREVLAEQSGAEASPPKSSRSTLVPGVLEVSLRGSREDVDAALDVMRSAGLRVWRTSSPGTRSGNAAGYRYFTLELPSDQ